MTSQVDEVADWVRDARRITVLTGAGISTDSGIPDFRGPNGVWTKDPKAERLATLDVYLNDVEVRREAWAKRAAHEAWTASPNPAHQALVDLELSGRLRALITQNVDGLHQRAGSSDGLVIEIHGTIWSAECLTCWDRNPMADLIDRVRAGEADPRCERCGGIVKSATISFGQALKEDVVEACIEAAADCDLFFAIGTSLTVHPAAGLCDVAVRAGARLLIVNAQPTPYDDLADAVVNDPIGRVLPDLVGSALRPK
ncbi:MAG TPA: Sir2 family NAD-dependent protein deacetylase [Mycobacteriales bacterium]|nr:Sir2 family NAD-dependent protein deacetylase [Mycobacteriales bacterium]